MQRGLFVSLVGHVLLGLMLFLVGNLKQNHSTLIIATGSGTDSGNGSNGGLTEVGVIGASELLRFYPQLDLATLGNESVEPDASESVSSKPSESIPETPELIPATKTTLENKHITPSKTTDRPVARTPDKPYTPDGVGRSTSSLSALVGVPGSPNPGLIKGGIGIGQIPGSLGGIAGGSEYGRRIQQALINYYRLVPTDPESTRFVIVRVRIDRNGSLTSLENGRIATDSFVKKSENNVIDFRVEGALLELDRHPIPFPPGFLPGAREATVEIYFQY